MQSSVLSFANIATTGSWSVDVPGAQVLGQLRAVVLAFLRDVGGRAGSRLWGVAVLFAAAVAWIGLAVWVACPVEIGNTDALYTTFYNGPWHALILGGLLLADIVIAIGLLDNEAMFKSLTTKPGLLCVFVCGGAFVLTAVYATPITHGLLADNRATFLAFSLFLICVPRAVSYGPATRHVRRVHNSLGR